MPFNAWTVPFHFALCNYAVEHFAESLLADVEQYRHLALVGSVATRIYA